jgi:glycosyltransferase involved in cell wall biosynthesis
MVMTDLSIITGPGSHAQYLVRALGSGLNVDYTNYWPRYEYVSKDEKKSSGVFDKASYLLYGLRSKFTFISDSKWHQDILFPLYDRINAKNIQGKNLIGWPQVSLRSMQKVKAQGGKIILEQPMIHVNAWNAIATQEYDRLGIKNDMQFSEAMTSRMKREYDLADQIVVHSRFSKKTFIDNGVESEKITACSLGLEIRNRDLNKQTSDDLQVLFVGRVEVLKGLHFLLDAIKQVGNGVKLHVVGHIYENAKSIVSGKASNVEYYGQLAGDSLKAMYEQADVLVFPSLYDGFGMVILEAMSFGLPVIASRNSAGPDIVKDFETGFLVDPFNADQIAQRLSWMRNHPDETRGIGLRAKQQLKQTYSFENYKNRILKIVTDSFQFKQN